jgi:hypothetical protein
MKVSNLRIRRIIREELVRVIDEMKTHDGIGTMGHRIPVPTMISTEPYPESSELVKDPFSDFLMLRLINGIKRYFGSRISRGMPPTRQEIRDLVWDKFLYHGPRNKEWEAIDLAIEKLREDGILPG